MGVWNTRTHGLSSFWFFLLTRFFRRAFHLVLGFESAGGRTFWWERLALVPLLHGCVYVCILGWRILITWAME